MKDTPALLVTLRLPGKGEPRAGAPAPVAPIEARFLAEARIPTLPAGGATTAGPPRRPA